MSNNNEDNTLQMVQRQEQMFMMGEYYRTLDDTKLFTMINRARRAKILVAKHIPMKYLGPGWNARVRDAEVIYRPDITKIVFNNPDTDRITLNSYIPPKHLETAYWDNKTKEHNKRLLNTKDWNEIPDCYLELFSFIFDNDFNSITYFMDWLSKAVDARNGRNLTALVLISTPGVGKGVLFEHVIRPLFGQDNTGIISGENAFVNQFNGTFADKQVVLLDEANLTEEGAMNRFKTLVNDSLEVEKKGKEKYNTKNWLNLIIASNNLNSIFIEEGDRRFSVVNTNTSKMLGDMFVDIPRLISELSDEKNISLLYSYLIQHQPARDMNRPFKSEKLDEIKDAGLKEWERFTMNYINEALASKRAIITLKELKDEALHSGIKFFPGHTKIKSFANRFKQIFTLKRIASKNNAHCLELLKAYDTSGFDKVEAVDESKLTSASISPILRKISKG